ncbi:hypothetical protein EVAR_27593_1 [Eumeta japonica]|uniref:Uncharacterized protein n=1 Tax=Eumeta variegata TaxID=151549 RepID=A0A4C1SH29_EUMVA|nr:hypothetical protein EVAR_27593_1 [Eumeta japonica]
MDVDHEKLLSGDVNFKWQRDFTAFTAIMINNRCRTKSKQPLAASNQPVTDCEEKNNNEENVDDCDERAEAGRQGQKTPHSEKYTRRCKEMKKNCEKGTIIACHSGDVMVLAGCKILSMISTFHDNSTYTGTSAGEECEKPICVKTVIQLWGH